MTTSTTVAPKPGDFVTYENRVTGSVRPAHVLAVHGYTANVRIHLTGRHFIVREIHVMFLCAVITNPYALAEARRVHGVA